MLSWFEPTDSIATGDQMFWDNEMAYTATYPERIQRYVRGFFWGIRNPAYGFADWAGFTIGVTRDFETDRDITLPDIDVGDINTLGKVYRTVYNDGNKYFEYRHVKTWFFNKNLVWYVQLGWSFSATGNFTKGKLCHLNVYIRPFVKHIK